MNNPNINLSHVHVKTHFFRNKTRYRCEGIYYSGFLITALNLDQKQIEEFPLSQFYDTEEPIIYAETLEELNSKTSKQVTIPEPPPQSALPENFIANAKPLISTLTTINIKFKNKRFN